MRTLLKGKISVVAGLATAGLLIWGMQEASAVDSGQYYVPPGIEMFPCLPIYSISTGEQLSDCDSGTHPVIQWTTCKDRDTTLFRVDSEGQLVRWGYDSQYTHDSAQGYDDALAQCDPQ